jgi:hypothetical protein
VSVCILHYQDDRITTTTPYKPGFVRDIKRAIPSTHREFNPDQKQWVISIAFERELVRLCHQYFDDVTFIKNPSSPAIPEAFQVLWVLPGAPKPVVDAAYRALTRMHHPDRSDDPDATARMQQINLAYEQASKEVAS